jgi:hypothetical protein
VLLVALAPARAAAEATEESIAASAYSLDRPHTLVDVGLGALTVPDKRLCITTTCTTTDLTLLIALRHFYKWNRRWGVGAGISWGLRPGTEDATLPGSDGLAAPRTHARNYFSVAAHGRYYPIAGDLFDVWTGVSSGIIVVSDRYATEQPGTSLIGARSIHVASEGFMAGLGIGADWALARNWTVGAWTSPMLWRFPSKPGCVQTNECGSVSGTLFSFETGLSVTYRVRL